MSGPLTRRRTAELPEHPDFLWRKPELKKAYDVIIIGAGGHGLATAYYLAKNFGITNVAVLEKGWLAGGNMARNTTIIRSNYLWDESAGIYEHSLKLWENLEEEVGYEMFFSQRGVMTLAHSVGDVRSKQRNFYARLKINNRIAATIMRMPNASSRVTRSLKKKIDARNVNTNSICPIART